MSTSNDGRKGTINTEPRRGRSKERTQQETQPSRGRSQNTSQGKGGGEKARDTPERRRKTKSGSPVKAKQMNRSSPEKVPPKKSLSGTTSAKHKRSSSTKDKLHRKKTDKQTETTTTRITSKFASIASGAVDLILGSTGTVEVKKEVMDHNQQLLRNTERERMDHTTDNVGPPLATITQNQDIENGSEDEPMTDTTTRMTEAMKKVQVQTHTGHNPDNTDNKHGEYMNQQHQTQTDASEAHPIQQHTAVPNPYARRSLPIETAQPEIDTTETQGSTPKSKGAQPSYAAATNQTVLKTHEQLKLAHSMYAEISFQVERECRGISTRVTDAIIREVIINILKRGKYVDKQFAINPYFQGTNLPTIRKPEDVPHGTQQLKSYLPHQYLRYNRLRQGKNSGFKINLTFTIPQKELVHLWEASRRENTRTAYVQLKATPMQDSETYHAVGYFINSSEKQCIDQLREELAKEAKMKIGIDFRAAALDKKTLDTLWREAKEKAGGNSREMFKRAPLAMQAYAPTKAQAREAAEVFYKAYGRNIDGLYPRMPDGSRMRFVPAAHFLDMKSRQTYKDLMRRHIWFQANTVMAPIPISDPYQRFEAQGNRTMTELLLDLKCKTKDDEPYFKHIIKKWTRDYDDKRFEVAIHTNMYTEAASILRNLQGTLKEAYGDDVARALGELREDEEEELASYHTTSLITLDTEDRYLNGKGQFIFEGLEKIATDNDIPEPVEERSMNVRSTMSGFTDHRTVGSGDITVGGPSELRANQAVDSSLSSNTRTTPRTDTDGFTRVGSPSDEEKLRQRMQLFRTHDPGGGTGLKYP